MMNEIDKYSDIGVNDVPQASGRVFTSEMAENERKENKDYILDKQREHDVLVDRFNKVKDEVKPYYESQQEDAKRLEQIGKEMNLLNNEILTLKKELQTKKEKYISSRFRKYLVNVISVTFIVPFAFVLMCKIVDNPALASTSDLIQYLIGLPTLSTVMGTLLTYPFFERKKKKYENEYLNSEEFDDISSKLLDKELLMDIKNREHAKLRKQIVERNKIIDDCEYRMRCIKWQIENIREEVMNKLFKTPNNGTLGISIENYGTRQVLGLKI